VITGDLVAAQAPEPVRLPSYPPIRAKDDFVTIPIISPRAFEALADLIDPGWKQDARFSSLAARGRHIGELLDLIEQWTQQRPAEECERTLASEGIPCARFLPPAAVLDSAHLAQRGSFATLRDAGGEFRVNRAPFRFAAGATGIRGRAPKLGEGGERIAHEWLAKAAR
jgi:crotonobetainyl-CoA:carnitine CoA-transferase CaiB-like acyl-CoA transferase